MLPLLGWLEPPGPFSSSGDIPDPLAVVKREVRCDGVALLEPERIVSEEAVDIEL